MVDLAEVNDRVFVNNVSLGVYAEAVQSESYRDAKLRTLVETMPAVLGPQGEGLDLHWVGPDGRRAETNAVVLVSNDPYRLGSALGSGTRPRMDAGLLGVAVVGSLAAVGLGESSNGPPSPSRSSPPRQWRPGSTARRCGSTRRCAFDRARGRCAF